MKTIKGFAIIFTILLLGVAGMVFAQDADEDYVVGDLNFFGFDSFAVELATLGYVEGENLTTLYSEVDNALQFEDPEEYQRQYEQQIQAMVDAGADVFVVNTDTDVLSLQPLVGDIPIVFARSDDPVANGVVDSLLNPGGTATGNITNKPHERRLQLLTEILPSTDAVYYLYNPTLGYAEIMLEQVQAVAADLGVTIYDVPITDLASGMEALENIPEDVDWLFLTPLVLLFEPGWDEAMIDSATSLGIGTAYILGEPSQGWTIGYGPTFTATDRQAAQIVDLILRGASPSDIPVRNAENLLFVNLEAAEAIDLNFPLGIMRQADTIVRPGYFEPVEEPGTDD